MVCLPTPLSSQSKEVGFQNSIALPNLSHLELGNDGMEAPGSTNGWEQTFKNDCSELFPRLVSARKAAFEKQSISKISLAAHGLQHLVDSISVFQVDLSKPYLECYSQIEDLRVLTGWNGRK